MLHKINKKIDNLAPCYYRMKSNKFKTDISGTPIDL